MLKGYIVTQELFDTLDIKYDGHIYIYASLNDTISGWFLLDTGAPTILYTNSDKDASYNSLLDASLMGVDKTIKGYIHGSSIIKIGNTKFNNIGLYRVNNVADSVPCLGIRPIGILGQSVIRLGVWQIKYKLKKIVLSESLNSNDLKDIYIENFLFSPYSFSKMDFLLQYLFKINESAKNCLSLIIDTGYPGDFLLKSKNNYIIDTKILDSISVNSIDDSYFNFKRIEYNKIVFYNNTESKYDTIISSKFDVPNRFFDGNDGLIGNKFLENFNIIIVNNNPKVGKLILQRSQSKDKNDFNHYGLGISYSSQKEVFYVSQIIRDYLTPSERYLVTHGDTVISINGSAPGIYYCDYRAKKFDRVKVTIQHQGIPRTLHLKKQVFFD